MNKWENYKTNERPSAKGFKYQGYEGGVSYEVKLYWAPADWNNPNEKGKRAYINFRCKMGKMNSFGQYETEFTHGQYVNDEVLPRRDHRKLTALLDKYPGDTISRIVDGLIAHHYELMEQGFKRTPVGYDYPEGATADDVKRACDRAIEAFDKAKGAGTITPASGEAYENYDVEDAFNAARGHVQLTDEVMIEASATDLRRMVRAAIISAGVNATFDRVERVCSNILFAVSERPEANGDTKLREWYRLAYPTDSLGEDIRPDVTFMGLYECLRDGHDVYDYFGVGDSVLRERFFEKLAELMGRDYDYVYDWWLHHAA